MSCQLSLILQIEPQFLYQYISFSKFHKNIYEEKNYFLTKSRLHRDFPTKNHNKKLNINRQVKNPEYTSHRHFIAIWRLWIIVITYREVKKHVGKIQLTNDEKYDTEIVRNSGKYF